MRILYLAPGPSTPDGVAAYTFLTEEIHGLADRGHLVFTLSPFSPASGPESDSICVRPLPDPSLARRMGALTSAAWFGQPWRGTWRGKTRERLYGARIEAFAGELATKERIDVIHSHFGWPTGWGGRIAAAVSGKPLFASLRGMDLMTDPAIDYGQRLDPGFDSAIRLLLRKADITTYPSDFLREKGIALGADPSLARTIRKGVDLDRFRPARDRVGLKEDLGVKGTMILVVAGLLRLKGIDHILQALPLLPDHQEYTLVVCGEGKDQPVFERLADEVGLSDRVRFLGRVPRAVIPRYFAACDVFVLASLLEAAGNVVLEAMAAGRPVVCTESGGPPEYVRHERTGYVVPIRDPAALADRIGFLLAHPGEADRMGEAGRRVAEAELSYGRMLEGFEAAYADAIEESVLKRRRRS